jgi:uridylate kinase
MFDLFEKFDGTPKVDSSNSTPLDSSSSAPDAPGVSYASSSKKTFVLSVGGSVFFSEKFKAPEIAKFCEGLNELMREGYSFVIVVGGGRVARVYQSGAKALGANNFQLDEVGIAITRANALFFTYGIENAWKSVLTDPKEAETVLLLGKTPVFGGTTPGQTTDAVGAIIAELMGANFINISNVDGIYSADPAKEEHARMFKELSHVKMLSLLKAQASKPGAHVFVDPHAASILTRSNITGYFINGSDFDNFKNVVRGLEFKGTTVRTITADDAMTEE